MRGKRVPALLAAAVLAALAGGLPASASGGGAVFHKDVQASLQKPAGWDEPSGIGSSAGHLFVAAQNPELPGSPGAPDLSLFDSSNGTRWQETTPYYNYEESRNEGTTGDVTMTADAAGTVFVGHLTSALQADIDWSRDGGKTWQTANDVATLPSPGAASNSPFLVDRPWIAAYSPDGKFADTDVYLEYHDFVTSFIYVVTCTMSSGFPQCGAPVPVSNTQTACNSIPGGIAVSPAGSNHPGRVYAVWDTADPVTNFTSGCNYTQLAPFYSLYVAWSDTPSTPGSWHQVPVYIGPNGSSQKCPGTAPVAGVSTNTCADMSEVFTPVAVDRAGNVYVSFVDYITTLDPAYDVYLERSTDGGDTWDGKTDGSGPPVRVSNAGGTHYIPNLVAGDAGRVAVVYYATSYTDHPYQAGSTCPTTVPPETSCQGKNMPEPPNTKWVVDVAESLDATAASPTFTQYQVSDPGVVVHYGDICNLGIYCDGSSTGNRSLFENNTVFTDKFGYLVVGWGDQRLDKSAATDAASSSAQTSQEAFDEIFTTCQTAGPSLYAHPAGPSTCGAVTATSTVARASAVTTGEAAGTGATGTLAHTGGDPALPAAGFGALIAAAALWLLRRRRA
jgi:LPXTG-motif cell wall-anchored protein